MDLVLGSYQINELQYELLEEGNTYQTIVYNKPWTKISIQYLPISSQPTQLKIADFSKYIYLCTLLEIVSGIKKVFKYHKKYA